MRTEDPQEPHIADQVKPTSVQKHGSNETGEMQSIEYKGVVLDEPVAQIDGICHLIQKAENVDSDDEQCHHRRRTAIQQRAKRNHCFDIDALDALDAR